MAALLHRALGDKSQCIFINHGLLRLDEENLVVKLFKDNLGIQVIYVDAEREFLQKLKGVRDPELERKIIGEEFANTFIKVTKKMSAMACTRNTLS